tara:strand:+ start:336 stop:806 length:471 start_codon:yes stop_codon:yes gene_type:complete
MIKGEESILYVKFSGIFLPIGCLTSNGIDETVEMIGTTTRANNGWKTSIPNTQSFTVSFEGLQLNTRYPGGDFSKISYDLLKRFKRSRALLEFRIITQTNFIEDFKGYIRDIGEAAPVDDFLTFSGLIEGYGEPITSYIPIVDGAGFNYTLNSTLS